MPLTDVEQSLLFDALKALTYRARIDGQTISFSGWSGNSHEVTGHNAAELAGEAILRELFGSTYKDWRYHLVKVAETGEAHAWERDVHTPTGRRRVNHRLASSGKGAVLGIMQYVPPADLSKDVALQIDVLENLPVGVYFVDFDYKIWWTNQLGTCQSHINWKNHYGSVCYNLPFGRETKCDNCPVAKSLVDGQLHTNELKMPNGDTWLLSAMPTFNQAGERIGAIEVVTDVTPLANERNEVLETLRQHEAQLRAQNKALASLHSHQTVKSGEFEKTLRVVTETAARTMNAAAARILLYREGRLACLDDYSLKHGLHRTDIDIPEFMQTFYRRNLSYVGQLSVNDVRGAKLPEDVVEYLTQRGVASMLYCPIREGGGSVVGIMAFADDKPRNWGLEEQTFGASIADFMAMVINHGELVESRRSMSTLMSNLPGMAFRLQYDIYSSMFAFVSEGCLELTGYSAEEIRDMGKGCYSLIFREDFESFERSHREPELDKSALEIMYRIQRKDGSTRWVLERSRLVAGTSEQDFVYEGFMHDITERYQLKEAELASKTKSEFLAQMSHEIRTPMNAVIGMVHLIQKTSLSDQQRDYVSKIQSSASSLLGIINDIFDFSQIESGRMALETEIFNLDEVLAEIEGTFAPRAKEKGLTLSFGIAPEVPRRLVGDSLRLDQVITNLLGNSLKFTESGDINVTCKILRLADGFAELRFSVRDTGIGMTPEQQETVFTSFRQADHSISRKYGGTGLGLTIVKALVDLMNGEVNIDSEPGKGTEVTFTCRLRMAEQPMEILGEADSVPRFRGQEILLVEDNEINREIGVALLEELNLRVITAENGREAIEKIYARWGGEGSSSELPFAMVLMDLQMPVMDGYQATRLIRGHQQYADMPIIAMTAHALDTERQQCLEAGMNGHISKPIDVGLLHQVLKLYLREE